MSEPLLNQPRFNEPQRNEHGAEVLGERPLLS